MDEWSTRSQGTSNPTLTDTDSIIGSQSFTELENSPEPTPAGINTSGEMLAGFVCVAHV